MQSHQSRVTECAHRAWHVKSRSDEKPPLAWLRGQEITGQHCIFRCTARSRLKRRSPVGNAHRREKSFSGLRVLARRSRPLYNYCMMFDNPPEARLLAAAKCEAIWESAVNNRESRPDLDLLKLHAVTSSLDSLKCVSPWEYFLDARSWWWRRARTGAD
jgi:hypothetical protein